MEKVIVTIKDADGKELHTAEPDVVRDVLKELATLGTDTASALEAIKTNHGKLKETIEKHGGKLDGFDQSKIDKLAEDMTTRQSAIDELNKKLNSRLDDIEVSMKRTLDQPGDGGSVADFNLAKQWTMEACIMKNHKVGHDDIRDEVVSVEDMKQYEEMYMKEYIRKNTTMPKPEVEKALNVGVDSDGGILVPPTISNRIIQRVYELDAVRGLANVETIGTDALEIMVDQDEADDGWIGETQAGDETNTPQWDMRRIPVHIQYARPKITQKMLDDAAINVEQWLANHIARRFGRTEGAAFITGTGVGRPRGILTYDAGINFRRKQIEQIPLLHASLPTTKGLIDLKFSLLEEYLNQAQWLMNRLTVAEIMKLQDGEGRFIWRPGLDSAIPSSLLNVPLKMSTTMPEVAANALSIAIADWTEFYTIVDRQGISIQRDPFTKKPFVEMYTRKRVGGDVVNFQAGKLGKISVS